MFFSSKYRYVDVVCVCDLVKACISCMCAVRLICVSVLEKRQKLSFCRFLWYGLKFLADLMVWNISCVLNRCWSTTHFRPFKVMWNSLILSSVSTKQPSEKTKRQPQLCESKKKPQQLLHNSRFQKYFPFCFPWQPHVHSLSMTSLHWKLYKQSNMDIYLLPVFCMTYRILSVTHFPYIADSWFGTTSFKGRFALGSVLPWPSAVSSSWHTFCCATLSLSLSFYLFVSLKFHTF